MHLKIIYYVGDLWIQGLMWVIFGTRVFYMCVCEKTIRNIEINNEN